MRKTCKRADDRRATHIVLAAGASGSQGVARPCTCFLFGLQRREWGLTQCLVVEQSVALLEVDCLVPLENVGNESETFSVHVLVCVVPRGCGKNKAGKRQKVRKCKHAVFYCNLQENLSWTKIKWLTQFRSDDFFFLQWKWLSTWKNKGLLSVFSRLHNIIFCYFAACDDNHWGSDCRQQCKCENGALCDPVKGACQCPAGYIGRHCEDSCPAGTFGKGCLQRCKCGAGGSCDQATGECLCRDGFTGTLWVKR